MMFQTEASALYISEPTPCLSDYYARAIAQNNNYINSEDAIDVCYLGLVILLQFVSFKYVKDLQIR